MALREIRTLGDQILNKRCKEVKTVDERTKQLIEDMYETMYESNGVGLAAPQVGVLKRLTVIDIGDDNQYTLINPVIISAEGTQTDYEGCLSVPNKRGVVTRPESVVVKAFNENMEEITINAEGLLARAVCHELDHLDGKIYVDLVEGELRSDEDIIDE